MKVTLSLAVLALASTGVLSYPSKRDVGPSGTLVEPQGGAVWNDDGYFTLVRVFYQGVDTNTTAVPGAAHVKTHHISLTLVKADGSGTEIVLANGIAPDSDNVVDVQFQTPVSYASGNEGEYNLVVVETQIGTGVGPFPQEITFQSAAPLITLQAEPVP